MDLKLLKGMTLDDLLNVDYTKLKEEEVQYVERRLIRTVNRRINKLKTEGLLTSSRLSSQERKGLTTYKAPKDRVRTTRGGKPIRINVRNKLVKSANKAREILMKKTSTATGVTESEERYRKMIGEQIGNSNIRLDKRRLKRINKLMKKAEELYALGDINKALTGSPQILQTIVDIVKSRKYVRNDQAEEIIGTALNKGYRAGQEMLNQLLDEDKNGTDIDFPFDE